ncbi:NlpC/P60 family protein [Microbispora sp. NPDC049633]|uniref:aggregation-promoting factor C-terminal-like domain-containing protein n=1 Tax=Microbispora sp. NPDC049633 TaxID=3154355 RepID=UPI00341BFD9A
MTTPNDPAAQYIVRILNINKLEQASTSFATATTKLQKHNDNLGQQLSKLTTTLDKLVQQLQRGGGGGGGALPSTGSGGKTRIGGDATFGGIPHGQHQPGASGSSGGGSGSSGGTFSGQSDPSGSGGNPKTPNGGGSKFTVTPTTGQRIMAAIGGTTPKHWKTSSGTPAMFGALETGIASAKYYAGMFEQQAIAQQDTNLQLGMLKSFGQQYRPAGMSADAYRQQIQHYAVGTITGDSTALGNISMALSGARGYALSDLDNYQYTYNMYRYASGLDNAKAQGLESLSSAIGAVAPGIGATGALQRAHSMVTPGARMRSRRLGLGDPVGKNGKFEGATQWAKRFLKRIYQGREAVDPAVFDIDFQTDATGYIDLQVALGREDVDDFVQILRSVNKQLYRGQDVSWMDQALTDAHKPGTKFDKTRDRLAKADITFPSTDAADMARSEAVQRGQALIANDSYLAMQDKMTTTVDTFDAAVNNFTNSPIIRDLSAWAKNVAVTLGPMLAKVMSGASAVSSVAFPGAAVSGQDAQGSAAVSASPITSTNSSATHGDSGKGGKESGVSLANAVINEAKRWRGKIHYRMGAGRDKAGNGRLKAGGLADCSSFVNYVYAKAAGIHLGSWTGPMAAKDGIDVPLDEVVAGDILLMNPTAQNGHVGIAISRDKFIDNSSSANGVTIKPMNAVRWTRAKRVIGYEKSSKGKFGPVKPGDKYDGKAAFDSKGSSGGGSSSSSGGGSASSSSGSSSGGSSSATGDWGGGGGGGGRAVGGGGIGLGAPGTAFGTDEISALAGIFAGGGAGASGGGGGGGETTDWGGGDFGGGDSGSSVSGGTGSASTSSGASTGGATNDPDGTKSKNTSAAEGGKRGDGDGKGWKKYLDRLRPGDLKIPKTPVSQLGSRARRNMELGHQLAAKYGWGEGRDWAALQYIWFRESGWNDKAEERSSGAYGIPQANPSGGQGVAKSKEYRSSAAKQISWGLNYIKGRYGDPEGAWAFWHDKGWYDKGAWKLPKDELAVVHKDEMIIPARQAKTIREALVEENIKAGNGGKSAEGGSGGGGKVVLQIASGAIVVHANGPVTEDTGKTIIRGMLKELDRKNLYAQIARGVTDDD